MTSASTPAAASVVVIGGGLAGLAAAARLAKSGHHVRLVEATEQLGGSWAPFDLEGVRVDRAPSVLGFPAPWRDLFRKSGRPLEAELGRLGVALEPTPPARYVFADGQELRLPEERGGQYAAMVEAFGVSAATRWRDLVDRLGEVWQVVRPLGLEAELRDRSQLAASRKLLQPRRTIRHLADRLDEPHLAALVCGVAYRLGSVPSRTPAWCAVELFMSRTFGRWAIGSDQHPADVGRTSVLVDALTARLALRKVDVQTGCQAVGLTRAGGAVTGVRLANGTVLPASAVVSTIDAWQTYGELLVDLAPATRRRLERARRRWQPALAPEVSHRFTPGPDLSVADGVSETVVLSPAGVPTITYARPVGARTVHTVHDYLRATASPSAGIAWDGFGSWLDRPPVTTVLPGLFTAGPFSAGGGHPSAVVLSGALASYACHDYLS